MPKQHCRDYLIQPRTLLALLLFFLIASFNAHAQNPVAGFSATPTTGCAPLLVNFSDLSTGSPTTWQWDLGNGATSNQPNPSTIYATPGTYTVKLTVTNANGTNTLTRTAFITVNASPTVDFSVDRQSGCFPLNTQFTDLSTPGFGNITGRTWSFGTGATSTAANPSYTYTDAGNYFVSLTVTNSAGCARTFTRVSYINVSPGVKTDFSVAAPQACKPPENIAFTNLSTGPGTLTYLWDFGDGNTSTALNPLHTYNGAGPFTVKLTTISDQGCSDVVTKTNIAKLNNFQPQFNIPANACQNETINFNNSSTPLPGNTRWEFGDGTFSTQSNTTKSFSTPGTYFVRLINNYATCSDTLEKNIVINPRPVANFSSTDLISCRAPHTASFQDQSLNAVAWEWNFGDGSSSTLQNPSHTYTAFGNYTVRLIVTNAEGCKDTLTRSNYIRVQRAVLQPTGSPFEGCVPLTVNFSANASSLDGITAWSWNFGDGNTSNNQNPSNTYINKGNFPVTLQVTTGQGCVESITLNPGVRTGIKPTAAFTETPNPVCTFGNVQFTDLSVFSGSTPGENEWGWNFGDGTNSTQQNPVKSYQNPGTYTVQLRVFNNRCPSDPVTRSVTSLPPVARFNFSVSCTVDKKRVVFTDQSIGPGTWNWNFGDGNSSTAQNPTHTYAAFGTYTVTLTTTNGSCSNSISRTITLLDEKPQLLADKQTVCKNEPILFTASSINAANIISYQWNFGNGITRTTGTNTTSYAYPNSGNYNVTLSVRDLNNCTETITINNFIRVNGPTTNFTVSQPQLCVGSTITLNNTSVTDGVNAITNVKWHMGNGAVLNTLTNPIDYTYPLTGQYSIKLVATDASGCADSITRNNVVWVLNPKAQFSAPAQSCPGSNINFVNQTTGTSGSESYVWNFGNGITSTQRNPVYAYLAPGTYTVRLTVQEPVGCSHDTTFNILIDTPFADFDVNDTLSICLPFQAMFTNKSTYSDGTWNWNFGDGSTSGDKTPVKFFTTPGNFNVVLTVRSPGGCVSTASQVIRVATPSGTLSYNPLQGCSPHTVDLKARSSLPLVYTWDFGDGFTISTTDSNRTHTYDAGFYVPLVIMSDRQGCSLLVKGIDTIKAFGSRPGFGFNTDLFCDSGTVSFSDSTISADPIVSYNWNFGDGANSAVQNPVHTYLTPGRYDVTLSIQTQTGCVNSITKPQIIKVVPSPQISITGANSYCVPSTFGLQGNWLNPDTSSMNWRWNADGQIFTTQSISGISRPTADTVNVRLIATNGSGCRDTADYEVVVHPLPNVFAGNDSTICLGTNTTLNPVGALTYVWDADPTLSCTNCTTPVANPTNDKMYYVTGTSPFGCVNRDSMIIRVKQPFNVTVNNGDTLCVGDSYRLHASGAEFYNWTPPSGLSNPSVHNPLARPQVTTFYQVVGVDSFGCFRDTGFVNLIVYNYPLVNAGADTVIKAGNSVQLIPQLSPDITFIQWSPAATLSCTGCTSPVASPLSNMTYTLRAANIAGCTTTDQVRVIVTCDKNNIFMPNAFTPNNDGLNDRFYVISSGLVQVKSFRIFDRWGTPVFERLNFSPNDRNLGWDGTAQSKPTPSGLYVYSLEVICGNGEVIPVRGQVTLIR